MSENTNTSEKSDHKDNPLHWLPHRAQVAIQREIDRLRRIADHIESAINESEISDENA